MRHLTQPTPPSNWGTHQPVLMHALTHAQGPTLELGAGDYSTRQIDAATTGKIVTVDSNSKWLFKFYALRGPRHQLRYYDEAGWREFYAQDQTEWGVVFVDCESWALRAEAVWKYKDTAEYVVVHDCDYFPLNNLFGAQKRQTRYGSGDMGERTYDDVFRWWVEFFPARRNPDSPPTLLGSNIKVLDAIVKIDGMVISNRNK